MSKTPNDRADHNYAPSVDAMRARSTGAPSSSRRRGWLKSDRMLPVLRFLARGLLNLFWLTCRIRIVQGREHLAAATGGSSGALLCYWHQMHLFCARFLLRERDLKLAFLISPSHSGDVVAGVVEHYGATALRGSDTRTGGAALQQMYKTVREEGLSPVLTLDGPSGPALECKPGSVMLARITGAPMVPLAYAASKQWELDTWDRFIVPRPFSRIAIVIGKPIEVPPKLPAGEIPNVQAAVKAALDQAAEAAQAALR